MDIHAIYNDDSSDRMLDMETRGVFESKHGDTGTAEAFVDNIFSRHCSSYVAIY